MKWVDEASKELVGGLWVIRQGALPEALYEFRLNRYTDASNSLKRMIDQASVTIQFALLYLVRWHVAISKIE